MRIVYASQPNRVGTGWLWSAMLRLAVLTTAALALLAITLVGVFVVLPLMIVGGIALSFFSAAGCARRSSGRRIV